MTKKEAFIRDFEEATQPKDDCKRVFNSASLGLYTESHKTYNLTEDEIYLYHLRAENYGQGQGKAAMIFLTALADRHGIDIVLHAGLLEKSNGSEEDPLSEYELVQFYKKFGFEICGGNNEMVRHAKLKAEPPVKKYGDAAALSL